MQETWVQSLDREDPLEKEWLPTLVFSPGKSHGQRSLMGYSPWGHKELDRTEPLTLTLSYLFKWKLFLRSPWIIIHWILVLILYHVYNSYIVYMIWFMKFIKSLISANEGGRHAAWAHKLALVPACFVNLSKSLPPLCFLICEMELIVMHSCMIALLATMSVPAKCSGPGLAHCNHSVADRWVVTVLTTVMLIFPEAKRNNSKS